jgi:hypothetical protein
MRPFGRRYQGTRRGCERISDPRQNFSQLSTASADRDTTDEQQLFHVDIKSIFAPKHSLRDGVTVCSALSPVFMTF